MNLYPRTVGVGSCTFFGRVGSLLAPQVSLKVYFRNNFVEKIIELNKLYPKFNFRLIPGWSDSSCSCPSALYLPCCSSCSPLNIRRDILYKSNSVQVLLAGKYMYAETPVLVPFLLFGSLCLISALLTLLLPETMDRDLPDTLQQAVNQVQIMR